MNEFQLLTMHKLNWGVSACFKGLESNQVPGALIRMMLQNPQQNLYCTFANIFQEPVTFNNSFAFNRKLLFEFRISAIGICLGFSP
jgi:hypothetical protein